MADNDLNTAQTVSYNGDKYVVIDTVIPADTSYWAPQINGRQGDNMRPVNICLKHDGVNWNLGNYSVDLVGRDNKGVLKETNTVQKIVAERGLICVSVPQQFYQAVGDYQECFLEIKDESGTVVSSVRVAFTVWANNTLVSRVESETYLQTIDQFMKNCEAMIETIQDNATSAKQQIDALNDLLKTYQALVQANAVALLNKEQTFGAKQTFGDVDVNGTLTANKLAGQAMDDISSSINAISSTLTGDGWNQNYTLTNGASQAADNQYYIQQFTAGKLRIIAGVGKIHVPAINNGQKFSIMYPYNFGRGSVVLGSVFETPEKFQCSIQAAQPNGNGVEVYNTNATANSSEDLWFNTLVVAY